MKVVRIMGGLGNQMFQYALYLALKYHCKEEIKIDLEFFKGNVKDIAIHNGYELNRVFNIVAPVASPVEVYLSGFKNSEYKRSLLRRIRFKLLMRRKLFEKLNPQESYAFFDDFLNNRYNYYNGYWVNEQYFSDIRNIVLNTFRFPQIDNINKRTADKILNTNSISIHVRRGDYLSPQNSIFQDICTEKYYMKAIEVIHHNVANPHFFVFSDDIEWCRKIFTKYNIEFVYWNKGENSFRDMQLMSLCKHNIIANSTFSWWGAWLNSNREKIVCAPARFTNVSQKVKGDCPNSWIRIDCI